MRKFVILLEEDCDLPSHTVLRPGLLHPQLRMALPHDCKPSLLQTPESSPTACSSRAVLPARSLHPKLSDPPALHSPAAQIQPKTHTPNPTPSDPTHTQPNMHSQHKVLTQPNSHPTQRAPRTQLHHQDQCPVLPPLQERQPMPTAMCVSQGNTSISCLHGEFMPHRGSRTHSDDVTPQSPQVPPHRALH